MIGGALEQAGASLDDVVAARVYVTDIGQWEAVVDELRARLGGARPALTMVEVARLILPEHAVEIEVEAVVGPAD